MGHKITIVIEPGGKMSSTVEGAPGRKCEEVSQWLDLLGRVVEHRPTVEAHAHVSTGTSTRSTAKQGGRNGRH
jgi:hypothetical protein